MRLEAGWLHIPVHASWQDFGDLLEETLACNNSQVVRFLVKNKKSLPEAILYEDGPKFACLIGSLSKDVSWGYSHLLYKYDDPEANVKSVAKDIVGRNIIIAQVISMSGECVLYVILILLPCILAYVHAGKRVLQLLHASHLINACQTS